MSGKIDKKSVFYRLSQRTPSERENAELEKKAKGLLKKGIIAVIVWGVLALWLYSRGTNPVAVIRLTIAVVLYFVVMICLIRPYKKIKNTQGRYGIDKYTKLNESEKQLIENDILFGDKIGDVVFGQKYVYVTNIVFNFFLYSDIVWLYEVAINREPSSEDAYIIEDESGSFSAMYMLYKSDGDFYSAHIGLSRKDIDVQEIIDFIMKKNPDIDVGYSDEKLDHYKSYVESRRK